MRLKRIMDCAVTASIWHLPSSGLQVPRTRTFCPNSTRSFNIACSYDGNLLPAQPTVFTASRLNASTLRIIGPGSSFGTNGLGIVVAVDEFFVHPSPKQGNIPDSYQAQYLTYFLEETPEDDCTDERDSKSVRHGIQVFFQTRQEDDVTGYANTYPTIPLLVESHVRERVPSLFLESGNGKGGAEVKVVAGDYEDVSTPRKQEFVLLDIVMRPGSTAKLPVHSRHGLIIYILEGVGIFKRDGTMRPFYENEGHGLWFPPSLDDGSLDSVLHVTCHTWSSLRFLVLVFALC